MNDEQPIISGQSDIFSFLGDKPSPVIELMEGVVSAELVVTEEQEAMDAAPVAQATDDHAFVFDGDVQLSFVDSDEWWKEHWWGMPEFIQDDLEPWKSMYIHFACREDMVEFARIVGQSLTADTRSIWFPKAEIGRMSDKVFVNE
jgi:hypothetical protein